MLLANALILHAENVGSKAREAGHSRNRLCISRIKINP